MDWKQAGLRQEGANFRNLIFLKMETKDSIMTAYRAGKTLQSNHLGDWIDWTPQNQVDSPNLDHGTLDNWRVKPEYNKPKVNINTKRSAILSHKLIVLMYLMQETLDEMGSGSELSEVLKVTGKALASHCEKTLEDVYKIKGVSSTTYFQEMANKVDTVIRKNFEAINN